MLAQSPARHSILTNKKGLDRNIADQLLLTSIYEALNDSDYVNITPQYYQVDYYPNILAHFNVSRLKLQFDLN